MQQNQTIEVRDTLEEVPAADWNRLNRAGNPFLTHEFLQALADTGCLGESTGWYPRYFLLRGDDDSLLAAVPTYVKTHSYGEFVFDWAWASAYERHGLEYYPKLIAAIPFTPATGQRLLVREDQPFETTARLLALSIRRFADAEEYSSVHWLFVTDPEQDLLCEDTSLNTLRRVDCQYHWHNHDYADFDAYLAACTARRRKTIRRERRHVSDAGLRLQRLAGHELSGDQWHSVHALYASTYDRKWGNPSLTRAFFQRMGQTFGERTLIVLAWDPADDTPEEPVACSIMFVGDDTLYGRYWGCRSEFNSLHFEACYYQGIEYCIERGLACFEPGAQGEHKITRGFVPTLTRSAHYIAHPQFRDAIRNFLEEETPYVEQRCAGLTDLLPFKQDTQLRLKDD